MENKEKDKSIKVGDRHFKIPPDGSIGLLALGNVGVRAWKKAKKQWEDKQKKDEA